MNRCPITYEFLDDEQYSDKGLKQLHRNLTNFLPLPYTAQEQRSEAALRMKKMSIQGVQPKLSAILNVKKSSFEVVDLYGKYIIKPPNAYFRSVPEIEDLSMKMAKLVGIETPFHGLVYAKDGSLSYFIRRFDRVGRNGKRALEDFSQLAGLSRQTKYRFSIEKMIAIIEQYCTFPFLEKIKFFRLVLFCWLIGNEDMHVKNFSLISRNNKIEFSPAYDLLSSTLAMGGAEEEMALTLAGKKSRFRRKELIDYFGQERLGLSVEILQKEEEKFHKIQAKWEKLIGISFLKKELQKEFFALLEDRFSRLRK